MLAAGGHRPTGWRELLDILAPQARRELDQYPWYAGADVPLPLSKDVGDIATRANAVRVDSVARGVELIEVHGEVLPAGHFNRLVGRTRNKAVVMLALALRVVDRMFRIAPDRRVRVCVDRLGGRSHYRESLTTAFPEFELQVLEESASRSSYRLVCESRICDVEFVTGGETRHFPIALGSVFSKYVRELCMHVFNRYWTVQQSDLRPTAGYFVDAQRWLRAASRTLDRLNVDRTTLVRSR